MASVSVQSKGAVSAFPLAAFSTTSGVGSLNRLLWKGYLYDKDLGCYCLGKRHYDPFALRFWEPDGLSFLDQSVPGGVNPYIYCLNDPITYTDQTGRFPVTIGLLLLGFGIGAALGASASIVTQGLTNGWDSIDGWQVLLDAGIGGISGALSFSGIGPFGMTITSAMLGFAGSVGGDLIAHNGDWSSVNWSKAGVMAGINGILGYFAGAGVQNKAKIGETLSKVSPNYRAVMTAFTKYGRDSGFRNVWNLYGNRCLYDIAMATPSILAGRMFVATSTMASTAVAMTLLNWGADSWTDWW